MSWYHQHTGSRVELELNAKPGSGKLTTVLLFYDPGVDNPVGFQADVAGDKTWILQTEVLFTH